MLLAETTQGSGLDPHLQSAAGSLTIPGFFGLVCLCGGFFLFGSPPTSPDLLVRVVPGH